MSKFKVGESVIMKSQHKGTSWYSEEVFLVEEILPPTKNGHMNELIKLNPSHNVHSPGIHESKLQYSSQEIRNQKLELILED